ncbi:MAG: peptide chain release factor 2, partial [Anaerolineales bacterium]|nr:peptide chain release factor 2 [Anaerolineales bacterium]
PDLDNSITLDGVELRDEDLEIDTMRSGGAGGQHVNRTESAVRITHLPSGIVVQCQSERSQHQNRAKAFDMLRARLYEQEIKERNAQKQALEESKADIGWGSQIRSYVLHPYKMVKDHRTNHEVGNAQAVLDGRLDDFMEAYLRYKVGHST